MLIFIVEILIFVVIIVCEGDFEIIGRILNVFKRNLFVIIMKGFGKVVDLIFGYLEKYYVFKQKLLYIIMINSRKLNILCFDFYFFIFSLDKIFVKCMINWNFNFELLLKRKDKQCL